MGRTSKSFIKADLQAYQAVIDRVISNGAFGLYCWLSLYEYQYTSNYPDIDGHPNKWFFKRDEEIIADTGIKSKNTLRKYREELEIAGLIIAERGKTPPTNYELYPSDSTLKGQHTNGKVIVTWYCVIP